MALLTEPRQLISVRRKAQFPKQNPWSRQKANVVIDSLEDGIEMFILLVGGSAHDSGVIEIRSCTIQSPNGGIHLLLKDVGGCTISNDRYL